MFQRYHAYTRQPQLFLDADSEAQRLEREVQKQPPSFDSCTSHTACPSVALHILSVTSRLSPLSRDPRAPVRCVWRSGWRCRP